MDTATQTTGIVVNGQLHLDRPLPLPDQSRVLVTIQSTAEPGTDWRQSIQRGLEAIEELKLTHPIGSGGVRYTREQLHERR